MAEVLLFHHAHGLTAGVQKFANTMRAVGHTVHVPDLYDGQVFERLEDGLAYAQEVGVASILERGRLAAERLPSELVYAGISLGVVTAQLLAQTQPGARGALLLSACVPTAEFGGEWPHDVPVQIHAMDGDEIFVTEGDLEAARALAAAAADAELFLYPGTQHLFADESLPSYEPAAAALLTQRVLGFLASIGD